MAIYPPAKSRSIRSTNGHMDDFDTFFNELRSRWVKVERLQEYDESDSAGYQAFKGLQDIVPRPGHKPSGEERAWGRRLAKRFGAEGRLDDRTFVLEGDGGPCGALDHEALKSNGVSADVAAFFKPLNRRRGDSLIAFGWAMAEDLAARITPAK